MTTCVIVDLAGLSLSNFNMSTQKLMNAYSKIDQVSGVRWCEAVRTRRQLTRAGRGAVECMRAWRRPLAGPTACCAGGCSLWQYNGQGGGGWLQLIQSRPAPWPKRRRALVRSQCPQRVHAYLNGQAQAVTGCAVRLHGAGLLP